MAQKGQKDAGSSFAGNLAQGLKHLPLLDRIMLIGKAQAEESKRATAYHKARMEARGKDGPKPGDVYRLQFVIKDHEGEVIDFIELVCVHEGFFILADPLCRLEHDIKRTDNGIVRYYHICGPQFSVYHLSSILAPENRCDVVSADTLAAIEVAYDRRYRSISGNPKQPTAIEVDIDEDDPANDIPTLVALLQEIAEEEGIELPSEGPATMNEQDVVTWLKSAEEDDDGEPEDPEEWAHILQAHMDEISLRGAYDRWFHEAEKRVEILASRPAMDYYLATILELEENGIGIQDFRPGWMIFTDTGDDEFRDLPTGRGIWGSSCFEILFPGLENPWKPVE